MHLGDFISSIYGDIDTCAVKFILYCASHDVGIIKCVLFLSLLYSRILEKKMNKWCLAY